MTKLMEWLLGLTVLFGIWLSLVTNRTDSLFVKDWMNVIFFMPVLLVLVFGVYAASVVLWRVYTFNNCEEAAKELQQEIILAKEDLKRKGYVFETGK